MDKKEFDDFFKDLAPEDIPVISDDSEEEDLVFSSFFEDKTTPAKKEEPVPAVKKTEPVQKELFFENDLFPAEKEEKPAPKVKKAEPERKQTEPEKINSTEAERRKKKKRYNTAYNWLLTIVWVSAVLAVSVFIASFALSSINDLVGFSKESREVEITIPEGYDLSEIAELLKNNGIIDEPFTFEVYARIKEMDQKLDSGTFMLNSNLGYDQIFQALKTKEKPKNVVTVNFYEGMTLREIATRLEENGVCGYDEFMEAAKTETFEYEFEGQMGTDEKIYLKWEGYLFPDTYEFYTDSTPRSVIAKFIDNFNNKFGAEYYLRMKELGMSLEDVITLASVIQSEAAYIADMKIVSSVFHNRLTPGSGLPYLQSDVTYFYYTENIEPYVEDETLSNDYLYAYYTYTDYRAGLPVGPICNPGINAIKAALYPDDTNYYYFVTDHDGNFYYAKTMAEHEANIIKAGRG